MFSISPIVVPVLPIPAEQCTIALSSSADFKFQSMKKLSIVSKSSTRYPSGIPWSGHPIKWTCVTVYTLLFESLASNCLTFRYSLIFYVDFKLTSSFYSPSWETSKWIGLSSLFGQNCSHLARPASLVLHVLTIKFTLFSIIICQKWLIVWGSGP